MIGSASRSWLLVGPAGPLLALGVALLPVRAGGGPAPLLAVVGGLAVVLYLAALVLPWPGALPWAMGMLAVEYVVGLELRGQGLDPAAPAYAAAWFISAELGWLGLEARRGGRAWPGRLLLVGLVALAGSAVGVALLLVAALPLTGGAPLTGLGVLAALAAAACLAWLARR
jgi:hypothetical protein